MVNRYRISENDNPWTQPVLDRLRELYAKGELSHKAIAGELNLEFRCNLSRNAVIGKVSRLGLSSNGRKAKDHAGGPTKAEREKRDKMVTISRSNLPNRYTIPIDPMRRRRPPTELPPEQPISLDNPGVTLLELEHDSCRWPVADGRYCGAKQWKRGRPYCAGHDRMSIRRCQEVEA